MARGIDLSTIGVKLGVGFESAAGVKPTTYERILGVKSIPDFNTPPEGIDSTTFEALQFKTYIDGLRDTGGAIEFKANLTQALMDQWHEVYADYLTNKAAGKAMWVVVWVPGLDDSFFFSGNPSSMGLPAMEVNTIAETSLFITPTFVDDDPWQTAVNPTEPTI